MRLSIVIPAFNEEKLLRSCLRSVQAALAACARPGLSAEVIVCDNNSTDATPEIARQEGAAVVFEPHNQISRARNAGARAAAGEWLLFIDADSLLRPGTLGAMLDAIAAGGCAGGGCVIEFDVMPRHVAAVVLFWNLLSRAFRWAAGSFVFCRADAFREVGGFSQDLYAAEEIGLSMALHRWARPRGLAFTVLHGVPHMSSGRKASLYSVREILGMLLRLALSPRKMLGSRDGLFMFYDRRR
ncbi:MAG: glycosyltransferase [Elusimicrobia bacterium]|nr:glycosyltransferase [Elusimicrobiota bacterium]